MDIDPFNKPAANKIKYLELDNLVLFFDIVGFSKDSTTQDMRKSIQKIENSMTDVLWNDYNWNKKTGKNDLVLIPTGDGYGLGFHPATRPDKMLRTVRELYTILSSANGQRIRMGMAKGPNIRHIDLNETLNIFGYGINLASRMVNLAQEGQILVHEDYARGLLAAKSVPGLTRIVEPMAIKHGGRVGAYNYYKRGEFGCPHRAQNPRKKK